MKSNLTKEHYKWLIEHSYPKKESCLGIYIGDMKGFIKCYSIWLNEIEDRDVKGRLILDPFYKFKYYFKIELLDLPFEFIKKSEDIEVDGIKYYLGEHREDRYGIETKFISRDSYTQKDFEERRNENE